MSETDYVEYDALKADVELSQKMLREVEQMEIELLELEKEDSDGQANDLDQTLPLPETRQILASLRTQDHKLSAELHELRNTAIPAKRTELEQMERELIALQSSLKKAQQDAEVAVKTKEQELKENRIVNMENIGGWHRYVIDILQKLLFIEAISLEETETVEVKCRTEIGNHIHVKLLFSKGLLYNAHVSRIIHHSCFLKILTIEGHGSFRLGRKTLSKNCNYEQRPDNFP